MIINGNLKFASAGFGELQNAVLENLTTTARDLITTPGVGRIIFNTTTSVYNFYDGTTWQTFGTGGGIGALQTEVDAIEAASGSIFNTDGTYLAATLNALGNITNATTLADALGQLDAAITAAAGVDTLGELTDVTLTTPANTDLLQYNGTAWVNVASTTIGEFGFKTINGDSGSAVADILGDTLGLVGATNGGVTTVGENTGDTVSFALTPVDLATSVATMVGGDFIVVSDSLDTATTSAKKITITKLIQDLDLVTAAADGMLVRTGADTYASRTITASAVAGDQGISVVNGNGVTSDPTIGLDIVGLTAEAGTPSATDLLALYDGTNNVKTTLSQLNSALIAVGTALNDLTDVTITAAANNEFLVFNSTSGAWVDTTPANARTAMDVYSTGTADSTFVNVAGDTMTGNLAMGTNLITGLGTPLAGTDATNKSYVDALVAGLTWKNAVIVASTANINLTTGGLLTIDGVILTAGQRVLVKDQTTTSENGIYAAAVGAWTRVTDMDSLTPVDEVNSAAVFVEQGTVYADTGWTETATVATLGTDPIIWTQFNGASGITAGVGLAKTGNTLDVNLGAGIAQLPSDEVGVDLFTDGGLRLSDTVGGAASTLTGAKLRILVDGTTLSMSTLGIKVPTSGITATEISSAALGNGLTGGSGTVLSADLKTASGLVIDTGQISLSAIPNSALANNSITLAADTGISETTALGDTLTLAGGTGIDSVVSATDTVTFNLNAAIGLLTDVDTTTTAPVTGDALIFNGTNWVPGEAANHQTLDLTDVTALATAAGQVLVADGSNNYTPHQIQFVDSVTVAATTWTVTHNLNQKFVNVTVYDSTDNMIIPQSVVATSTSVTTITFNTAITGTAVVMGINGLAAV